MSGITILTESDVATMPKRQSKSDPIVAKYREAAMTVIAMMDDDDSVPGADIALEESDLEGRNVRQRKSLIYRPVLKAGRNDEFRVVVRNDDASVIAIVRR